LYRELNKKNVLKTTLKHILTDHKLIYAMYGNMEFFQIPFENPYAHSATFQIRYASVELKLVTDAELLTSKEIDWKCSTIEQGHYEFTIPSHAKIDLPFKYQLTEAYSDDKTETQEIRVHVQVCSDFTLFTP
jgi:hypothetical protein